MSKHYSKHGIKSVDDQLTGSAIFKTSCVYDSDGYDQVNKLVGISIDKVNPHTNSLRIGWRCLNASDSIELLAYYYIDGERFEEVICSVKTDEAFDYTLSVLDGYSISITTNGNLYQWGNINSVDDHGNNWMLYPYFGGQMEFPGSIYRDKACEIYLITN
tara:strand:+ start:401 stop:880 length:480 start_codon:yes stop_codon:yes gene_type:complete